MMTTTKMIRSQIRQNDTVLHSANRKLSYVDLAERGGALCKRARPITSDMTLPILSARTANVYDYLRRSDHA